MLPLNLAMKNPAGFLARWFGRRLKTDARTAAILESIEDAFFFVDCDWRFIYASRSFAERYPRIPPEEMIGRSLWDVNPELLGTRVEENYRRAMETGVPIQFEMQSLISHRWFRISAYPTAEGLAVSAVDLTERRQVEQDLRTAKEEVERHYQEARAAREAAEEANRLKDRFLAVLSHELRTPLNAILGWTEMLRAGRLDPGGMARGLSAIERNARAQAQLIDDLLDVARITSGRLRLEVRPLDPAEVMEAALAAVLPSAEAKGIRIGRRFGPGAGPVLGDTARLQQVFVNLLSNAVKFTPRGGWIDIGVERAGEAVEVRVRDTGQGIAPEFLPHVFDSFRQADDSATHRQGGLGLGLAIVRQIVDLHGGRVAAESPGEGAGAIFTLRLPLLALPGPDPAAGRGASSRRSEAPPLAGLRVLAVDDDRDSLEMMAELLGLRGAEVAAAASAEEALAALQRFEPDVLVSDISMSGKDGYDLIRDIRSQGVSPSDLPAVAVTALASSEDRRRALDAGYQVHLGKPVDPGELTAVIAQLAHGGDTGAGPSR
ncbi:MAG TPA: ATP-binding protein [Thermoanaerobaculia bacterium]